MYEYYNNIYFPEQFEVAMQILLSIVFPKYFVFFIDILLRYWVFDVPHEPGQLDQSPYTNQTPAS